MTADYSKREKLVLGAVAAVGGLGLNAVFLYALFVQRGLFREAIANPISLAFLLEAPIVMGLLAYLLTRWGAVRIRPATFVVLSILGGLAFSIPVAVLWRGADPRRR